MRLARWVFCVCVLMSASTGAPAVQGEADGSAFEPVRTATPHSALFGLAFDGERGIAVGIKGAIIESSDGGRTWEPVKGPGSGALLAVAARGGRAVAVGLSGAVFTSSRSGEWTAATSGVTQRLLGVDMNASGLAVAVGEFGTVLVSNDWGATWVRKAPDWSALATRDNPGFAEPMIYGVAVADSGALTLAGEFGLIARSNDAGASWRVVTPPRAGVPTLNALHMREPGRNSYAVGQEGEIQVSADGGETWMRCTSSTPLNFLGVAATDNGEEVVVTGMRVMYRSRNNGVTWEHVTSGDARSDWYQAVRAVPGRNEIYAVGHSGRIIKFTF